MTIHVEQTSILATLSKSICLQEDIFFELWGASGGNVASVIGGYGAYTAGILTTQRQRTFYLYIGAHGSIHNMVKSYNGGGASGLTVNSTSGGGSTDIRLKKGTDFESLKSRIMVSAGGGGAGQYLTGEANGGSGGILVGYKGSVAAQNASNSYTTPLPTGGNTTHGGIATIGLHFRNNNELTYGNNGTFGSGGDVRSNGNYGGGGGGGYFGGGSGDDGTDVITSGAGGSSYVSGYDGCLAIDPSSTSTTSYSMLKTSYHSSGFYFTDIIMKDYTSQFPSPSGSAESGHSGNGAAAITFLSALYESCIHRTSSSLNSGYVFLAFVEL